MQAESETPPEGFDYAKAKAAAEHVSHHKIDGKLVACAPVAAIRNEEREKVLGWLWKQVKLRIGGEKRGYAVAKDGNEMPKALGHRGAQEAYESVLGLLSSLPLDAMEEPPVSDEEIAERRRSDPEFRARLERSVEENRELLERFDRPSRPTCERCGGSRRIKEARRAPVTEEWFNADVGPCPDCQPPDSLDRGGEAARCGGSGRVECGPDADGAYPAKALPAPFDTTKCPGCPDCEEEGGHA